ncbi:GntR family transcriptional regulator [Streptomyces sp. NPDC017454]|uniref:GntR family transcriptional regulator n=1 Tax=Streptomyces sp. NPDC017454 TaxID=3364997 RepID=UPI0037AC8E50
MSEIRTVEIDGHNWLVLTDVLASVGRERGALNPMFVARIPSEERQQIRVDGRWTWLVTEFGADWAAGQDWRPRGDPGAYGRDRAHGRAHEQYGPELREKPQRPGPGRPSAERVPERIAKELQQKIRSGRIAAGEKLPRIEIEAQERGLSGGTVRRAYEMLRDEGWIQAVRGRNGGYRVVGVPL